MREAVLQRERAWQAEYDDCYAHWVLGDRNVIFPAGTYKMRLVHRVAVAAPP